MIQRQRKKPENIYFASFFEKTNDQREGNLACYSKNACGYHLKGPATLVDLVVVGAGIPGLVAAFQLTKHGVSVGVLEAGVDSVWENEIRQCKEKVVSGTYCK